MTLPPSVRVAPTCNTSPLGLEVVSALNDFFSLDCFHDVDLGSISPVYETIPRELSEGCGLLLLLLLLLLLVLPSVWLLALPQSLRGLWQSLWCGAWLLVLEHLLAPLLAIVVLQLPLSRPGVALPSPSHVGAFLRCCGGCCCCCCERARTADPTWQERAQEQHESIF